MLGSGIESSALAQNGLPAKASHDNLGSHSGKAESWLADIRSNSSRVQLAISGGSSVIRLSVKISQRKFAG